MFDNTNKVPYICIMPVKIYETDSVEDIAKKIFFDFEVGASCSIYGFVVGSEQMKAKGELVWEEIRRLDDLHNCRDFGGKRVRKYEYRKGAIGGTIAQKIFTFEKRIIDKDIRYMIWRFQ